jgi:hypothetical protein
MPLVLRFAFLTAGCPKNEGAHNHRAVARSFLGLVFMTCGAWPPCHKVRSLVHTGGDFTRDASGVRVGGPAFKKGSISRAVAMPRSSCDHRALLPSGPPDGVRRCSLERSASRSSLLATSPPESARSWWCRQSCFLLAAVGGVQPHGSWHPSTIIRLQGFSSCSPAAVPRRRSPRRMTTSLVVGRSKLGCGLSPTLSFKDVHHPRWGGRRVESGPYPSYGLVTCFFLQHSEEKGVHQSCRGGGPWLHGAGRLQAISCNVSGPLGLDGSGAASDAASCRLVGAWLPIHRTGDSRAVRGFATSMASPARRAHWGTVQVVVRRGGGGGVLIWSCPHSCWSDGSENPFVHAEAAAPTGAEVVAAAGEATSCRGGCLRW